MSSLYIEWVCYDDVILAFGVGDARGLWWKWFPLVPEGNHRAH